MWIPSARLGHVGPSVFKSSCPTWHNSQDNLPEPGQNLSATRCAEQTTEMPRWRQTCSWSAVQNNPDGISSIFTPKQLEDAGGYGCPFQKTSDFYGFVASKFRCWPIPKWSPHIPRLLKKPLSLSYHNWLEAKGLQNHQDTYLHSEFAKSPSATVVSPSKLGIQTQRFTTQRHFPHLGCSETGGSPRSSIWIGLSHCEPSLHKATMYGNPQIYQ